MRFPYDNKVDLWSTGVIAYILLSGIMPFDSESRTRLYRQIIRGRYTFYPEVGMLPKRLPSGGVMEGRAFVRAGVFVGMPLRAGAVFIPPDCPH